jgi:hypothetical protein
MAFNSRTSLCTTPRFFEKSSHCVASVGSVQGRAEEARRLLRKREKVCSEQRESH